MVRMLVVGARPGSLGDAVMNAAMSRGIKVTTVGISGEHEKVNITDDSNVKSFFASENSKNRFYDHVVYTAGLNFLPNGNLPDPLDIMAEFDVNALGAYRVYRAWHASWTIRNHLSRSSSIRHFIVVSSNSAEIARSPSIGYCTSKAAASMMTRTLGRRAARTTHREAIWAVEPGWIEGTPMSNAISDTLPAGVDPHRIPHGEGINRHQIASFIISGTERGMMMNATVHRLDGGEQ